MTETPLEDFLALGSDRSVTPVVRRLFADSETPMGLYRKLAGGPGSFLLESADQAGKWSRYSFVGVTAHGVLWEHGAEARWTDLGMSAELAFGEDVPSDPLDALQLLHSRWISEPIEGLPGFSGGLVGHIGWDAVKFVEKIQSPPGSEANLPSLHLAMVKDFVAFDHHSSEVILVALTHSLHEPTEAQYQDALSRLNKMHQSLSKPTTSTLHHKKEPDEELPAPTSSRENFVRMVETAKSHIYEGDVFQVVLSQEFEFEVNATPIEVYRVLRSINPSPYMYLLECKDGSGKNYHVVGSSPEALVTLKENKVYSHPIAGSRPRGVTPEADSRNATELLADQKEMAEHLMLVDLARNDLSKISVAGSVEVTEFMGLEKFSHVMHLVSSVEGRLAQKKTAVDVFVATFPAGTLSGAPKPRALQLINDLESSPRGLYGGVVGYFGHSGDADLAITIRTVCIRGRRATVRAGAGIVADSDPLSEFEETISKASAPARAIRIANALEPDSR